MPALPSHPSSQLEAARCGPQYSTGIKETCVQQSLTCEVGVRKTNHFATNNSIQSLDETVVFVGTQIK